MRGAVEWKVEQDRTTTGKPGTGFKGQESMDMGAAGIIIRAFVGTIDGQGNFVRIGNSDRGMLIDGGKVQPGLVKPPDPDLQSHTAFIFVDGGVTMSRSSITRHGS